MSEVEPVNKNKLKDKIITELESQLNVLSHSADDAKTESFQETNVPLSQTDHRALEAGLLAKAQTQRVEQFQNVIQLFKNLPVKDFQSNDEIQPSALVELEHLGKTHFYFLGLQGAGTMVQCDGHPVEVITPKSPLGEELLDKHVHDEILVDSPKGLQEYKIKSIA